MAAYLRCLSQVSVVNVYEVNTKFERIRSLSADISVTEGNRCGVEDEINGVVFAPVVGVANGMAYGTQNGCIRIFRQVDPTDVLSARTTRTRVK